MTRRVLLVTVASAVVYVALILALSYWMNESQATSHTQLYLLTCLPAIGSIALVSFWLPKQPGVAPTRARAKLPASLMIGLMAGLVSYACSSAFLGIRHEAVTETSIPLVLAVRSILVAPMFEEWYCRGRLFEVMADVWSPKWAALVTSFLFCILHVRPDRDPALFPLFMVHGLVYGASKVLTGRLATPLVAHAVANACVGLPYTSW